MPEISKGASEDVDQAKASPRRAIVLMRDVVARFA